MLMKAMKRVMLDMTKNVSHHDRLHALKEFLKIYKNISCDSKNCVYKIHIYLRYISYKIILNCTLFKQIYFNIVQTHPVIE